MSDGVTDLLVRWEAERVAGRELSAEELCADCPALLEPVREGIRRLLWVNAVNEEASGTGGQSPRWTKGESPLPGFTLIEDQPFAKGGCGGVWRAVAPGGFRHVLKRVRLEGDLGPEEERAMTLLPSLRGHPHLLEVLAVRCFDKELVVAMEEADCSLKDRLDERRGQGLPIAEVLGFMRQAAEGVDHLNQQGIQHRDIKPGNLLLKGGQVKVGDYGLAKILEQTWGSHSGAMTPAYAAPEWIMGTLHRHSDQYSLAVTYFHLRTGHIPVDLALLLPLEARVIERALSRDPEIRWPSCLAFVEAVEAALLKPAATVRLTESLEEPAELTLPEELVLLSRHDQTGRRLANSYFNLALKGALLAELVMRKRIAIRDDTLKVLSDQATGDKLLDHELALRAYRAVEQRLTTSVSNSPGDSCCPLTVLPREGEADAEAIILENLVGRGILSEETTTRLWIFKRTVYPIRDPGPKLRLVQRLIGAFGASIGRREQAREHTLGAFARITELGPRRAVFRQSLESDTTGAAVWRGRRRRHVNPQRYSTRH